MNIIDEIGNTFIIPPLVESFIGDHGVCRQIFMSDDIRPDDLKEPYRLQLITSEPNIRSICPEVEQVQLPRSYIPSFQLSKNSLILVYEWATLTSRGTMVFAFDVLKYQLYNIFIKPESERSPFFARDSYAVVDNMFYFVGGNYRNHDVDSTCIAALNHISRRSTNFKKWEQMHSEAVSIADIERKKNLEVETFNFDTCEFEDKKNLTKFNAPKPNPIVFTFDKKIYAFSGRKPSWNLGNDFPSFEFLDTRYSSKTPSTWTSLPPPPFLLEKYSRHILWEEKKCLLVKVCDVPTEPRQMLLWKFDLEMEKWYNKSTRPSKSTVFLKSLSEVPTKHFEGCIYRDILFYFEDGEYFEECEVNPEAGLLVGHDLRGERVICRKWEIDLTKALGCVGKRSLTTKYLSRITGNKFCLAIQYKPTHKWFVNFLCICLFELEFSEEAHNLHINLAATGCHYFQMPNHIILTDQAKL